MVEISEPDEILELLGLYSYEAEQLGYMYAAYTDGDKPDHAPAFDELLRQSLKVRDLQRKLQEMGE